MMTREERLDKLREFNEQCRIKALNESREDTEKKAHINESVIMEYNGKFMKVPRWVAEQTNAD